MRNIFQPILNIFNKVGRSTKFFTLYFIAFFALIGLVLLFPAQTYADDACCVPGYGCQVLSRESCLRIGGTFYPDAKCGAAGEGPQGACWIFQGDYQITITNREFDKEITVSAEGAKISSEDPNLHISSFKFKEEETSLKPGETKKIGGLTGYSSDLEGGDFSVTIAGLTVTLDNEVFLMSPVPASIKIRPTEVKTQPFAPSTPTLLEEKLSYPAPAAPPAAPSASNQLLNWISSFFRSIFRRYQADFGDAPGLTFPSRLTSNGARHLNVSRAWFGSQVDAEPDSRQINQDLYDDGLVTTAPITFIVTNNNWPIAGAGPSAATPAAESKKGGNLYVNILADLNDSGDWMPLLGIGAQNPEWVVQNMIVNVPPGQSQQFSTGVNLPAGFTSWIRMTLTSQPLVNYFGEGQFNIGETEDYFFISGQHYQCYDMEIQKEGVKLPTEVLLIDQFGKQRVEVTKPAQLCAPTQKIHPPVKPGLCADEGEDIYDMPSKGPTSCCAGLILEPCEGLCTPSIPGKCIKQASTHLKCYEIEELKKIEAYPTVKVTDQFGVEVLDIKKPVKLCAPAQKLLVNSKEQFGPMSSQDPHYKCYSIVSAAKKLPTSVVLIDQFGKKKVSVLEPEMLCTPVAKTHLKAVSLPIPQQLPPASPVPPALSPAPPIPPTAIPQKYDHLKCYTIRVDEKIGVLPAVKVFDQFGIEIVRPLKQRFLCVPALKELISVKKSS